MKHLDACEAKSLAELYPDEDKPEYLSDYSWNNVKIMTCASGCPIMWVSIKRGIELVEANGW